MQAELVHKTCKICQQLKKRKTLYGHIPPKNIAELKPQDLVHVYLIGPYRNPIKQQQTGGAIISNNASLNYRTMIDPPIG